MLTKTRKSAMKWNIIVLLSLFGGAIGAASLFGWTHNIELFLWIGAALIAPVILARTTTHKLFLHGLYSGIAMGIVKSIFQILFWNTYISNNPQYVESFTTISMDARMFILVIGSIFGLVFGIILGGFSTAASKFHQPK